MQRVDAVPECRPPASESPSHFRMPSRLPVASIAESIDDEPVTRLHTCAEEPILCKEPRKLLGMRQPRLELCHIGPHGGEDVVVFDHRARSRPSLRHRQDVVA